MKDNRFWTKVDKSGECWIWKGCIGKEWGYGSLGRHKRTWLAHRWAWTLTYGAIPTGKLICHHCDNPPCVNPEHLFIGTDKDNANDRDQKGRHGKALGEKNPHAKLSANKIRSIRKLCADGLSQSKVAKLFGVTQGSIHLIVSRKQWRHIT